MLSPDKKKIIEELAASSSKEELIWMSGYFAGVVSNGSVSEAAAPAAKSLVGKITIAYGTETGN
jgi:sulfite reductase (NADPH) flavoprotein alpha-component